MCAPGATALRNSSRNATGFKSTTTTPSSDGNNGRNFLSAVASGPDLLAPGKRIAALPITVKANTSAEFSCNGRENINGTSATTSSSSTNTSINASGEYGGTPHTEAIMMSSISSASVNLNCLAISDNLTRLRSTSHGSITIKPATISVALRGPRRERRRAISYSPRSATDDSRCVL